MPPHNGLRIIEHLSSRLHILWLLDDQLSLNKAETIEWMAPLHGLDPQPSNIRVRPVFNTFLARKVL